VSVLKAGKGPARGGFSQYRKCEGEAVHLTRNVDGVSGELSLEKAHLGK
jgi:hypothetical protein